MNNNARNKFLMILVILLLIANAVTLTLFWLDRSRKPEQPMGSPREFLSRELSLDTQQQAQYDELVKAHRQLTEELRQQVKTAKDSLFELVKDPAASDSTKQMAARTVSRLTEQIDLLTLNHFQQVRKLCTPGQQKKFDELIGEVTRMMAPPRPPGPPAPGKEGPPPGPGMPPPHE